MSGVRGQPVPAVPMGGRLRLVAPSGVVDGAGVSSALSQLSALGFEVEATTDLCRVDAGAPYLAGEDARRADELMAAFESPSVDGVVCVRGGYGAMRLLPLLDPEVFRRHPKPLVGFSDITALHGFLLSRCGLSSVHGPLGKTVELHRTGSGDPWRSAERLRDVLLGHAASVWIEGLECGRVGEASGVLVGGNLTLIGAMAGSAWFPSLGGAILFFEEVGEAAYRIDRLLTQLALHGHLDGVAGVVMGDLGATGDRYVAAEGVEPLVRERVLALTGPRGIPVAFGLPCGHRAHNVPLGFGCQAILRCERGGGSLEVASPVVPVM